MDIRHLTDGYAVSPQIAPEDVAAIKAAGFTTVIDNRPDAEIPPELHTGAMRAAVEAAGLRFVANHVIGGAISDDNIMAQRAAIDSADGPVFAYCASGNRSSIVWAMSVAGRMPTDTLIATAAQWGYNLEPFRPRIESFAIRT
ncbi:MAG: TIGR01244 family protein [Rhodobacterales bacterium 32-67-9]|nr:MAG: TIGR01244 family protein [Rhodobacterales bacterium 32-67-9]